MRLLAVAYHCNARHASIRSETRIDFCVFYDPRFQAHKWLLPFVAAAAAQLLSPLAEKLSIDSPVLWSTASKCAEEGDPAEGSWVKDLILE